MGLLRGTLSFARYFCGRLGRMTFSTMDNLSFFTARKSEDEASALLR